MKPLTPIVVILACQAASTRGMGRFSIEHSQDDFGLRSHGIVEKIGPKRIKFYPLPQSTVQEYIRVRPRDFRLNPFKPKEYEREEVIGPYQMVETKIWFGKSYYDGEGMRGVGAFGYFDTSTRQYTLFCPREVAAWEVSAMLVEPDTVWVVWIASAKTYRHLPAA